MSTIQRKAFLAAVASIGLSTSAHGAIIGLDWFGTGAAANTQTQMGTGETAGVIPSANWNSFTGATSTAPQAVVDSTGAATSATVAWACNNVWATTAPDTAGDSRMMKGYLDAADFSTAPAAGVPGNTTTVTVAGLPASITSTPYSVIVYYDGDNGTANRTGKFSISGAATGNTTFYGRDAASSTFSGAYILGQTAVDPLAGGATTTTVDNNSAAALLVPAGNFMIFTGLTGDGFTLSAQSYVTSDGTNRASVNGIQVISGTVPEPTALGFVGLCAGAILGRRRARRA